MTLKLNPADAETIRKLFRAAMPEGANSGLVEIYHGNDYVEYPVTFRSSTGEIVQPVFKGWDAPETVAQKELTRFLSDHVSSMRRNLKKKDKSYWNHFYFILYSDDKYQTEFSYNPVLDERHENDLKAAIGDELYEKYQKEQNRNQEPGNVPINSSDKFIAPKAAVNTTSINELCSFLYREVTNDVPPDWVKVQINVEVFTEDGKQAISTINTYILPNMAKPVQFSTSNVFGPMNALLEIHQLMEKKGEQWDKAIIEFYPNGKIKLQPMVN